MEDYPDEKATPLSNYYPADRTCQPSPGPSCSQQGAKTPRHLSPAPQTRSSRPPHASTSYSPRSPFVCQASNPYAPAHTSQIHRSSYNYSRPRTLRLINLLRPWLPVILYGLTTLAFVVAIALYRPELFARLDQLARWLRSDEYFGYAVLFFLIFLTTFPPIPLYSTLITLSGYTYGAWTGAIISYFAALTGALTVFLLSRAFFRDAISRWLNSTMTIKRVVRAVEKRPKLLFLIRLAPYPYNVMNCLLAAAPTLTLRTYTTCTALSLLKVIIHTSMGASIHSFADFHAVDPNKPKEEHEHSLAELYTGLGIALCIAILVYLSIVARRAVDNELDDEAIPSYDAEERVGFLEYPSDQNDLESGRPAMVQSPFHPSIPSRPSVDQTR